MSRTALRTIRKSYIDSLRAQFRSGFIPRNYFFSAISGSFDLCAVFYILQEAQKVFPNGVVQHHGLLLAFNIHNEFHLFQKLMNTRVHFPLLRQRLTLPDGD